MSRSRGGKCAGVGPQRYTSLALVDVAGLSSTILGARAAAAILGTDAVPWVLLVGGALVAGVGVVVHRRPHTLPTLGGTARPIAILGACALLGAAVLSFYPTSLFTPERLWLCVLVALLVAAARVLRLDVSSSRVRRRAIDASSWRRSSSS